MLQAMGTLDEEGVLSRIVRLVLSLSQLVNKAQNMIDMIAFKHFLMTFS